MPVVVCGPYEYAIGVDQMGRGLPEPPGALDDPAHRAGATGPAGQQHKETEVVG
jgi:cytochrome c oxidase subunit 1